MKIIGYFLLLTFGFALQGFSQDRKKPNLKLDEFITHPELRTNLFGGDQFTIADTLKLEPRIVFPNPPQFFPERKLDFNNLSQDRMPVHVFPDPQSRIPIKVFNDSVNYTILKKEYR
ncbi:MAG: hypothetical protein PSV36_05095 [Algoriphagus sp.]|nr:hypothetical protein [Algoriphagus sp.]